MAPGACAETADSMSQAKIGRIIDALRHERYRLTPAKGSTFSNATGRNGR